MRSIRAVCIGAIFGLACLVPARAQTPASAVQSLFLGQRLCGDTRDICYVTARSTLHRYLHVIVHSVPTDTDWQVQAAPTCGGPWRDIAGGTPVHDSGYAETVVDLAVGESSLQEQPSCYAFRGREHYYVNFYAAYLDDNPQADAESVYPGYQHLAGRPDLPDLDVEYIHRSPAYAYDAPHNQPLPGEMVTFTAHVLNAGGLAAAPAPYEWRIDGHVAVSGSLDGSLAPGAETTLSLPWKWDPRPHTLQLRFHPSGQEISVANDVLSIRTDGLALGYWIEHSAWKYFLDRQWQYCVPLSCVGSDSFPDWLQRQIRVWNGMLGDAAYAYPSRTTVADRVRVDEIVVVPDGALPLHGSRATNSPDLDDHTVDLEWGLPAAGAEHVYRDGNDGAFNVDLGVLHELSHARSLADLYRFDLALDGHSTVDVRDQAGRPVFDPSNPFDQSVPLHAFYSDAGAPYLYADAENDLMSCGCTGYYSAYNALLLNRLRGRRARCGNANPPCNLGDWFTDVPPVARIRLVDGRSGSLAAGTRVRLFFDSGQGYNDHRFTQSDSMSVTVDSGIVRLPHDPFRTAGEVSRAGHNLLLLEVAGPARDTFCFIEPSALNLAFWMGYQDSSHPALLTLDVARIQRNSCNLSMPRARINDPFATSPWQSHVRILDLNGGREVTVVLRDAASPAHAMRGRLVQVLGQAGRVLVQGVTGVDGTVRLRASAAPRQVVDVTDNNLLIRVASPIAPEQSVLPR